MKQILLKALVCACLLASVPALADDSWTNQASTFSNASCTGNIDESSDSRSSFGYQYTVAIYTAQITATDRDGKEVIYQYETEDMRDARRNLRTGLRQAIERGYCAGNSR